MTVSVRLPDHWDTIIRLDSVDAASKTIRSFRGERLPTHGHMDLPSGAILALHAGGSRYWPGVTEVVQVTRAGALVVLHDPDGELRAAGSGRLESLGQRTRALLEQMRTSVTTEAERVAIRALGEVDADRLALIISLAQGDGFHCVGHDAATVSEFDPEVAA